MKRDTVGFLAVILLGGFAGSGCSPASAIMHGVKLVGDVVDEEDMQQRKDKLMGKSPAAAEEMFGPHTDAWRDVRSDREWIVYPVKMDVMDSSHYVVEVAGGRIVMVERVEKNANMEMDIPEELILKEKVKGKSPQACEAELKFGAPLLTARSESTGCLAQLYDSQMIAIQGITKPRQCMLTFDKQDRCEKVSLITVEATSKEDWSGF